MSEGQQNGWNELQKFTLEELKRLNLSLDKMNMDIQEMKGRLGSYSPEEHVQLKEQVMYLQRSDGDQESRLRHLEENYNKFVGKWGIFTVVGPILVSAIVGVLFKVFSS